MADKQLTTEEDILSSIGEGDDLVGDQTGDQDAEDNESDSQASDQTPKGQTGVDKTVPSKQGAQGTGKGTQGKQGQQQAPGPKDLVGADGKVIAKGGAERRFYEEAQKWRGEASKFKSELDKLTPQLNALKEANTLGTKYNLEPAEMVTAAQLLNAYKSDAKATIKFLLTKAEAAGIDVSDLTGGGGGVSTAAIAEMIEAKFKPLLQEREEKTRNQEIERQAAEQHDQFLQAHPDAAVHTNEIAQLLVKYPTLDPEAAYWRLKSFFHEKGLDFSKSLSTIETEYRAQNGGKGQTQQRTLPSGVNLQDDGVDDQEEVVRGNASTDDIVRAAMREAGMKI